MQYLEIGSVCVCVCARVCMLICSIMKWVHRAGGVCVCMCVCVYMHAYSLNHEMRSKSGALNPRTGPYKKRKWHQGGAYRGKSQVRTQREGLQVKERELRKKPDLVAPWSWTCSPQNWEVIVCCLSHPFPHHTHQPMMQYFLMAA